MLEVGRGEIGVGERQLAQVEQRQGERGAAEAADRGPWYGGFPGPTGDGPGRRIISLRVAPEGTIGYTTSCFSTMNSTTMGPPSCARARATESSISERWVTRIAGMP